MRRFIANNQLLFERISSIELKQLEYQKVTDEKFETIFEYIEEHKGENQKIFFVYYTIKIKFPLLLQNFPLHI